MAWIVAVGPCTRILPVSTQWLGATVADYRQISKIESALSFSSNDDPDGSAGAPENEIEVTPEMIEAGVSAVQEITGEIIPLVGGESREIAVAVYRAMVSLAPSEHRKSSSRTE